MGKQVWSVVSGALFGLGLMLSGMTNPEKVKGFLNFFGKWDPTLMFVLGTAVPIYFVAVKFARLTLKTRPKLPFVWLEPEKMNLKFFLGSALFGLGWGMVGLCPGPALVSLGGLSSDAALFFVIMMASIFVADLFLKRFE